MTLPIVHLNGTSRESLVEQGITAHRALWKGLQALEGMAPNGRDYYLEPGRLEKAQSEHAARVKAVRAVCNEIETWTVTLQDGE